MSDLSAALGATPPAEFDALTDADRAHLAAAIQTAADKRSKQIDDSVQDSLSHLPGMLRGTVRRALGM